MKVTFPYMGTVIIYKKLLELLGHEVIVPPRPSQRTIDLGVKYSPEFACFPFKVIMGSYIEACEMGVDTIVTSGGHGPCRAGFYGEIHKRILHRMGYDVDVIIFDAINRDKDKFMENVRKIKGKNSWIKLSKAVKFTYDLLKQIDVFDKEIHRIKPYEEVPGSTYKAWQEIQKEFDLAYDKKQLKKAVERSREIINSIRLKKVDEREKIRIGIVGEIFVVMEPSINMEIERILGELGCEVERSQYLSEWVDFNLVPSFLKKTHEEEVLKKGEKYIEIIIGGHAKQTVGFIVDFKDRGFDGVIHLMPFACLPELVSQSIIPKISKEHDIPVLTLSIDEQTGKANNLTRIEAFIDLIRNKKLGKFVV
ncbi:Predicted nucleotide-binding protein, sugar kinase/HSP70/actin superfamily [Caloranaerobacter azorensis DSM 13643]|uniref:Predicted nucleotide-binding protein, sugar kinase/HSP70/actin superfamily n=1 Tax=Caloranaerobacter azorensis DSM 13643 TaxID=1121264 RepID=A0A1M5S0B2_9FIRM|nr:2-hydroxyacyl-CoA dehydratase [Caloranaerobacter azorensis]SHH31899.1 Predicted nucleotide-binding protein, sugar kinase/HSP70/actin superfamily [Caloranaerobacter azorensis DSM 13643]